MYIFLTALISAAFGFGLAFYFERKINSRMQMKSQRILVYIAMISFGYGLMASVNELLGHLILNFNIRHEKLIGHLLANVAILPAILLVLAKLIGFKKPSVSIEINAGSNPKITNGFKYALILGAGLSVAYFGYVAVEGGSSTATYDFYGKVDYKNCNSPFEDKPTLSIKFQYKKETNEIFAFFDFLEETDPTKKQKIQKLENCSILNAKNWTCGGEWSNSFKSPKYMLVEGNFSYEDGYYPSFSNCPVKYVKR